ncbi:hypothetical protein FHS89_000243 [Rubricella aquisinus]|uniref:Lipid A 3-O-deacylase (PagL) n=1 Tax=Rubricella aquisinus TaxID=2028108 RepID=A0A840WX31_9RHOB|nr:hypothetical protein [Rubricella aquisinus]MBB5514245.1 hypothetical protein [Rubricella aquisinus]
MRVLILLLAMALPASANTTVFGGVMVENDFQDAFTPWELNPDEPGFIGIARSYPVASRWGLDFEVEGQVVRHFGRQEHWEVNVPLIGRYQFDGVVDSVAWGIGASYASEEPDFERDRNGNAQRALIYWVAELAFAGPENGPQPVLRLHHRSNGFGLVGPDGGSNAIAIGVRLPR